MTDRLKNALQADAAAVESRLLSLYPSTDDPDIGLIYRAEKYSLMAGGKRIRPFLTLEFCRAFGGKNDGLALAFAASVELVHTFSLIHDDLPCMDNDDLRRGKPTSHRVFGEDVALQVGDSMCIRAFETILGCGLADADTLLRGALALSRAAGSGGMVGGQITDMRGEKEKFDFDTLRKLHAMKTGAMIRVSAELGCIAAGLRPGCAEYADAIGYAENIGLAFQIVDDILDVTADSAVLGKNTGSDSENGKTTFLSFMDIGEAREYAGRVTGDAVAAIKKYPSCDILADLALWLLERGS